MLNLSRMVFDLSTGCGAPTDVAVAPDGSLYIAGCHRIFRRDSQGNITVVAGTGQAGYSGDGGPATSARLNGPERVDIGSDGSLYIAETRGNSPGPRVRRVGSDGIITTLATTFNDRGFILTPTAVAVGADDYLYVLAWNYDGNVPDRVYRMERDGSFSEVVQLGGDPHEMTAGPDGSLYIARADGPRIYRVDSANNVSRVAGTGSSGFSGDGGPATAARIGYYPQGVAVGPDGSLYIGDSNNHRIRRVAPAFPGYSLDEIVVPSEDGGELYVFSSQGRHLRTLNAFTNAIVYQFNYDALGQLVQVRDGDNNLTTVERDAQGNPTGIVGPYGQRTRLSLDANGNLASIINPAGEVSQLTYTQDGLLTVLANPRNATYQFTYDDMGRLIRDADPAGGSQTLARLTAGNTYTVTHFTAENRATAYVVDNRTLPNQVRTNTFPDGTHSQVVTQSDGTHTTTLADGMITTLVEGPDPRWGMRAPLAKSVVTTTPGHLSQTIATARAVSLVDPGNPLTLRALTDTVTVNSRIYTSAYDAQDRTFTDVTPAGRQSMTTIDVQGRVVQKQVTGLLPWQYTYDPQGRPATITQGTGADERTTSFSYGDHGYLETLTDPLKRTTHFEYDEAGRVTDEVLPDGATIHYAYDANGNVTSVKPPGKPAHNFTYTPVDLRATYTPPDVGAGNTQTTYAYNLDRQLSRIARPDGQTVEMSYDGAGRLSTIMTPRGTVTYGYRPVTGQLASLTTFDGAGLNYSYDGALLTGVQWTGAVSGGVGFAYDNNFRLSGISVNGGNQVTYQYDADSLVTKAGEMTLNRDPQNGLLSGTALGNITDTWSYNEFGEPISYRAAYSGTEFFVLGYAYDKFGRIIQKTETISGVVSVYSYGYDLAGRLAEVRENGSTAATYTYDVNGNRLSYTDPNGTVIGTYDDQDRLLQYGNTTYVYTSNGELLEKTENGEKTTFTYDVLGNLIRVAKPDGTIIEYLVDGQNRRIGRKVNGVLVQGFLYQDQLNPVVELDSNGHIMSQFVYASRGNVPDYLVAGGVTYRIIADHLGSPRLVINTSTGNIVERIEFDAFGQLIQDTRPSFQPFGFAGGLYEPFSGLIRFGARDYGADIGRWTAKDLVQYGDLGTNPYTYVSNDPVNFVDPSGLFSWSWAGLGGTLAMGIGGALGLSGSLVLGPALIVVGAALIAYDWSSSIDSAKQVGESGAEDLRNIYEKREQKIDKIIKDRQCQP